MQQSDIVVISVKPKLIECPLCGGDITEKNMKKSCLKNIAGHDVCNSCYVGLEQSYYENGVGCIYCGDKKTKRDTEENVAIINVPVQQTNTHIVVIERGRNYNWCNQLMEISCFVFCTGFVLVAVIATVFILGCIIYTVGNAILHAVNGDDHLHETEFTIQKCVFGYLGWLIVVYIVFTFGLVVDSYLSCCFKCYKVKCRPVIVKKLSQCAGWIEKKCSGCCILPNRNSNILFQEDCIKTYCCFAAFIATITICTYIPDN